MKIFQQNDFETEKIIADPSRNRGSSSIVFDRFEMNDSLIEHLFIGVTSYRIERAYRSPGCRTRGNETSTSNVDVFPRRRRHCLVSTPAASVDTQDRAYTQGPP